MLSTAYLFLIRFCKDNLTNQIILGDHVEFFVRNLETHPLVIFLVKEIFKNNKKFLTEKAQGILKFIVKRGENMPLDSIEKYHYLNILKTFVKCKDKIVKRNQNEILIYISGTEPFRICSLFNTQEGKAKARILINKIGLEENEDDLDALKINVPAEIANMVVFMELICLCCDGKNEVAESKAQTSV